MTSDEKFKEQCHGTYGTITNMNGYSDKDDWSFTEDLYKELKDNIFK